MHWETPSFLLLLWLLPGVAWLLVAARNRQRAEMARFAEPGMAARLFPPANGGRGIFKATGVLAGVALLLVGAARPRWGAYFEHVQSRGVDLFVLLDVSRSMLAEDVAPNRLGRAKSDVRDLLQRLTGDRVGLIVFAGAAVEQVPLTTDHGFFLTALDEVDSASAPRGGSLIGDAIRQALVALEPRSDRDQVLLLITDGEDHDSFPAEAAKQAADRGVKIFTVGLGDAGDGRRIPLRDANGKLAYLQHDGQEVWSKMDEKTLKDIALSTGGAYVPAKTTAYDLGQVYDEHLAQLTRGEVSADKRKRFQERFQGFLIAGFALLLIEPLVSRFSRQAAP